MADWSSSLGLSNVRRILAIARSALRQWGASLINYYLITYTILLHVIIIIIIIIRRVVTYYERFNYNY
jgi:hypothetical protein